MEKHKYYLGISSEQTMCKFFSGLVMCVVFLHFPKLRASKYLYLNPIINEQTTIKTPLYLLHVDLKNIKKMSHWGSHKKP